MGEGRGEGEACVSLRFFLSLLTRTGSLNLPSLHPAVEAVFRSYAEPPAPGAAAPAASSSSAAALVDLDSPLPPGTLTDNLGVGLVFVCTKVRVLILARADGRAADRDLPSAGQADQMNTLEREREFSEEQFDYIQQTLRTIALRCACPIPSSALAST